MKRWSWSEVNEQTFDSNFPSSLWMVRALPQLTSQQSLSLSNHNHDVRFELFQILLYIAGTSSSLPIVQIKHESEDKGKAI